jgi:hypothetical protein
MPVTPAAHGLVGELIHRPQILWGIKTPINPDILIRSSPVKLPKPEAVAEDLTDNATDDAAETPVLLDKVPNKVDKFYGDGAYDKWNVYETLSKRNIVPIIPPRKNAKIKRNGNSQLPPLPRDEAIRGIRKWGRKVWKVSIGYHRRSLAETAIFRIKTFFGDHLKNRLLKNQKTEAKIRCKIINQFTRLGITLYFNENQ